MPTIPSPLPLPLLGGPTDPQERIDALCASIHRLAAFGAPGIVCLTGSGLGLDPDRAREIVVDALRAFAAEAELAGTRIALEPYQADRRRRMDDREHDPRRARADRATPAAAASLGLQFDTWHLWNTPDRARRHRRAHRPDRRRPHLGRAAAESAAGATASSPATASPTCRR